MSNLKLLVDQENKLVADIRAILDESEKRADKKLSQEEKVKIEAMEKDIEEISSNIDFHERQAKREEEQRNVAPGTRIISGQSGSASKEAEHRAFEAYLKRGETRDLMTGKSEKGGVFVPAKFVNDIIQVADATLFIRNLATVTVLDEMTNLGRPTLETDPSDADWTPEIPASDISEDTSTTFGLRELKPNSISKLVKASTQLVQSKGFDVGGFVAKRVGYKVAVTQEKAFLTGSGASQPMGLFTAAASSSDAGIPTSRDYSTGNTTSALTVDGLIGAQDNLRDAYQAKAQWLFHPSVFSSIRKLKDSQNQYLLQPNNQEGRVDVLLGKKVNRSEFAPSTMTAGLYVGMYADFSYYHIAEVRQMEITFLNELFRLRRQVGWMAEFAFDGMPVLSEAFSRVTLAP